MTRVGLGLPDRLWQELTSFLADRDEVAGVLTARVARLDGRIQLVARQLFPVPESAYLARDSGGLRIASYGYVPALKEAHEDGSAAIFWHTHPTGTPRPSRHDNEVDRRLRDLFAIRTGSGVYASLVIGGSPSDPTFQGSLWEGAGRRLVIDKIRVAGSRIAAMSSSTTSTTMLRDPDAGFDRQIRAFGMSGQRTLNGVHAAVIGAGGTGSAVAEILARLGIGELTIVDADHVELSNVSRIHGASRSDVGTLKVDVARRSVERLGFGTSVHTIPTTVQRRSVIPHLAAADVIFGCTDDHAGRAVLSRLAYALLIPVVDMGFVVQGHESRQLGLFGRVTVVAPGLPCLICRQRVDLERVRAQSIPAWERDRLVGEGYVVGSPAPNPSVVSYTTTIASLAVDEFLDRIFGLGSAFEHSEALLLLHEWRLSVNNASSVPGHYCVDQSFEGRGLEEPLLGQLWAEA